MEKEKQEEIMSEVLPFWSGITPSSRKQLLNASVSHAYTAGKVLHAGKGDCSGLFLICSGRVRAYIVTEEGKEITLFRLLERDVCIFSASCMMKNINFDIWVSAETNADVIVIPTNLYQQFLQREICISNFTNELLSSRMSDVMWIFEQILFTSFDKRLASFLIEEANLEESETISLTHEQIANHMGSAREVVSRMLKYFASEKLIEMGRGSIRILDRNGLSER